MIYFGPTNDSKITHAVVETVRDNGTISRVEFYPKETEYSITLEVDNAQIMRPV